MLSRIPVVCFTLLVASLSVEQIDAGFAPVPWRGQSGVVELTGGAMAIQSAREHLVGRVGLVLYYTGFCSLPLYHTATDWFISEYPDADVYFAAINCDRTAANKALCLSEGASTLGKHRFSTFDVRLIRGGAGPIGGTLLRIDSEVDLREWLVAHVQDHNASTAATRNHHLLRATVEFPTYAGFAPSRPDSSATPRDRRLDALEGVLLVLTQVFMSPGTLKTNNGGHSRVV